MLRMPLGLFVGLLACGAAFSSIVCPDGNVCTDLSTCCKTTQGYGCCPYPKAVCCSDLRHCCPSGYRCDLVTAMCEKKGQPWMNIPMMEKEAAEEQNTPDLALTPFQEINDSPVSEQKGVSRVQCDNYYACPDGTTCCRSPQGHWSCCPFSPGKCCLDGLHCCPFGFDCDWSYQHCVKRNVMYPFTPRRLPSSIPAALVSSFEEESSRHETPMAALTEALSSEVGVVRCDSKFYCAQGQTCCRSVTGQWSCCPYILGQCCSDGRHCCKFGYSCDPSSSFCRKSWFQIPSGEQQQAQTD